MKFAIIALVATAAAADASDYAICLKGSDCKGTFICCELTKKSDLSAAPPGTNICVPALGDGTVPTDLKTGYSGYTYFCTKAHHTDPTNSPDAPKISTGGATNADGTPKASGAATIAVSATSAAVAAFMLA